MARRKEVPEGPKNYLRRLLCYLQTSQTGGLVLLAVIVGAAAGVGAVVFRALIEAARNGFFEGLGNVLLFLGPYRVILFPALGGAIVGPLIYFLAREAKGHGVPEVMDAVALQDGRIRPRVAVVKSLASSICIGSGGSAGREGPIVQIGSALGSTIGQLLKLNPERVRLLVACGAAGGISATFNAPIAGAIFALEVILRQFTTDSFGMVVLSSVTAAVVARRAFGDTPAFAVPPYSLVSAWELPLYFLLGIIAALVGIAFVRCLYGCEDLWDRWKALPEYLKPISGGVVIGIIGVWFPHIFGVGYETIETVLRSEVTLGLVALLMVFKVLATSVTIGSGGSGGIFAPSLFIGAMMGSAFGQLVHACFPQVTADAGAYAIVGMGAVFAAAAHAPMVSVLILFEMTNDYAIILPLMTSVVVATILSQRLQRENIYTLKLLRRGIDITLRRDINLMDTILVEEAMTRDPDTVPADLPVNALRQRFQETWHHGFPVLDEQNRLVGVVTLTDLEKVDRSQSNQLTAGDICTKEVLTCFPDETLNEALKRFGVRDVGRLPVVDRADPRRVVGLLRRGDIVSTYAQAALRHSDHLMRLERARKADMPDATFVEIEVAPDSELVGRQVQELCLPQECLLVSIRRGARTIIPHGDTVFEAYDRILALQRGSGAEALRQAAARRRPQDTGESEKCSAGNV